MSFLALAGRVYVFRYERVQPEKLRLTFWKNADQLKSAVHLVVSRASASAIARVEALGGSVTTRFYSPTSLKRVLRGTSHPVISISSPTSLIVEYAKQSRIVSPKTVKALEVASEAATPEATAARNEALAAVMSQLHAKYKYRLPDATSRKDIEYYRDPAHRGYLTHTMREGESPSLFFKKPGVARDTGSAKSAKKAAAKASAETRLF
jgi:large subunit ribosomal protein L15